jgi:HK97 family phage prohead protease
LAHFLVSDFKNQGKRGQLGVGLVKEEFAMKNLEVRYIAGAKIRTAADGRIAGYAAIFNSLSDDLGGFRERILPGAFRRAINSKMDVRALINHDPSKIIGRSTAGTLNLEEDSKGLAFSCKLPDTSYARDLKIAIDRGDISQCSFGFVARQDRWTPDRQVRELLDVDLFDVSTVTYPAYPDTQVQARAAELGAMRVGIYLELTDEEWLRSARLRLRQAQHSL